MPLSQKEIRDNALKFAHEWTDVSRERAESQTFWNEFFNIFGIERRRVATFEEPVKKLAEKRGSIEQHRLSGMQLANILTITLFDNTEVGYDFAHQQ